MLRNAKILDSVGGFFLCELFIFDEEGNPISVGFGIFDKDGLIEHCSSAAEGSERLQQLAQQYERNSPKMY